MPLTAFFHSELQRSDVPLPHATIDVMFSSNVLEQSGTSIHVLPNGSCRRDRSGPGAIPVMAQSLRRNHQRKCLLWIGQVSR
jgi:hypothetical protein